MTDSKDSEDAAEQGDCDRSAVSEGAELLFGNYSVLSPGVEIVIDGRTVSAPAGD